MSRSWSTWIILILAVDLKTVVCNPPGYGHGAGAGAGGGGLATTGIGGFLTKLFVPRLNVPEIQGERTEAVLPAIVREHHSHTFVKRPFYQEQKLESFGKQKQQIVHNHVTHQKVVHQNHQHQHLLKEHTQHNVHTHNLHNLIQHIHEHTKEQEHIHKPIYHQYEHHKHKVTDEHVTKLTENNKHRHAQEQVVTNTHKEPIHQKEWSFLGWLRAFTKW